jgi:hypothetical protein
LNLPLNITQKKANQAKCLIPLVGQQVMGVYIGWPLGDDEKN